MGGRSPRTVGILRLGGRQGPSWDEAPESSPARVLQVSEELQTLSGSAILNSMTIPVHRPGEFGHRPKRGDRHLFGSLHRTAGRHEVENGRRCSILFNRPSARAGTSAQARNLDIKELHG